MADLIGQRLGSYRVEDRLGTGGMGEVFRGVHLHLNRPVAIKVLHTNQAADPTFQARFLREARAAAALSHPNIVEVFDFNQQDDLSYLVMELVPNGSLRTLLRQRVLGQGWTLGLGVDLIRQAAEGLAYAHAHHMVHRDIKPDNLLLQRLSEQPERYQLKISDFGLARLMDDRSDLTVTGMVMGTPTYMSPEQCQGAELDGRSDLYSLGVVLFEVATGSPPFRVKTLSEAVFKHISEPPPRPRDVQPDLPAGLEDIILWCLAKQPRDRVPTGDQLAKALTGILDSASEQTIVSPGIPLLDPAERDLPTVPVSGTSRVETVTDTSTSIGGGKLSADRPALPAPALSSASPAAPDGTRDDPREQPAAAKPTWPGVPAKGADDERTSESAWRVATAALWARPKLLGVSGLSALVLIVVLVGVLMSGLRGQTSKTPATGNSSKATSTTQAPSPTPADRVTFQDAMTTPSSQWARSARSYFNHDGFEINGAWLVFAPSDVPSDGTISVRTRQFGGVTDQFYGLVVRAQNAQSYYVFGISGGQQWTFFLVKNGTHTALVPPTSDQRLYNGQYQSNTLAIRMRGGHFIFYANGGMLGQIDDGTFTSGKAGIVNVVGHLDVVYNDFSIAVPAA
jgi:serine/threonine protein kinase